MGPLSYMRSIVDQNVVMWCIPVLMFTICSLASMGDKLPHSQDWLRLLRGDLELCKLWNNEYTWVYSYIYVTLCHTNLGRWSLNRLTAHINLKQQLFLLQEQAMQKNTMMQVFRVVTRRRATSYRNPQTAVVPSTCDSPNAPSHRKTCIFSSTAKPQILHKRKH